MMCGACGEVARHSDGYSLIRIFYDTISAERSVVICPKCTGAALGAIGVAAMSLRAREATE